MAHENRNEGPETRAVDSTDGGWSASDDGLTLRDAVERYVGTELWNTYQRAAAQVPARRPPVRSSWMGSDSPNRRGRSSMSQDTYIQLRRERDRAWQIVVQKFKSRLLSGELIATGYEYPVRPGASHIPVPQEYWSFLRPNFRKNSVAGGGLSLIDVWVHRAGETAAEPPLPGQLGPPAEEPSRKGGRPNQMKAVKAIMLEWHGKGELGKNWSLQSRRLAAAYTERYHQPCNPNTVMRQLRGDYNALMQGK